MVVYQALAIQRKLKYVSDTGRSTSKCNSGLNQAFHIPFLHFAEPFILGHWYKAYYKIINEIRTTLGQPGRII